MKKIVLTGGGTAGHVTPHLALIPILRERGYEIHYFGTDDGIEHSLMKQQLHTVDLAELANEGLALVKKVSNIVSLFNRATERMNNV